MVEKLIVDSSSGKIVNIIELESDAIWEPPEGTELMDVVGRPGIGWFWDGTEFFEPPVAPPTEEEVRRKRLQVLRNQDVWSPIDLRETVGLILDQLEIRLERGL